MEKEKKTIKKIKKVPFRVQFLPIINDNQYIYYIDTHSRNNVKLRNDILDWFWDNAEEVYDYYKKLPELIKIDNKVKNKFKKAHKFKPNINIFVSDHSIELKDDQEIFIIALADHKAKILKQFLNDRGWPQDIIVCQEDCPGFFKLAENQDRTLIERIIIFHSLIEWNSYTDADRTTIINLFKAHEYKYYPKASSLLITPGNNETITIPSGFNQISFPLNFPRLEASSSSIYEKYKITSGNKRKPKSSQEQNIYYISDNNNYSQDQLLKIYQDIIEWFWDNSEKVYDFYEIFPYGIKISRKIYKMLTESLLSDGHYNITAFETKGIKEYVETHSDNMFIYLSKSKLNLLQKCLERKGWPKNVMISFHNLFFSTSPLG